MLIAVVGSYVDYLVLNKHIFMNFTEIWSLLNILQCFLPLTLSIFVDTEQLQQFYCR